MRMQPDPLFRLRVTNIGGGPGLAKVEGVVGSDWNAVPPVLDPQYDTTAEFHLLIEYDDYAWVDQGRGYFEAYLFRARNGQWVQVDSNSEYLGNDSDTGEYTDEWILRGQVELAHEQFLLRLLCKGVDTSGADDTGYEYYTFDAYRLANVGGFSLDYVPITIVYCPPGPDMVASLEQSLNFGTRLTIGDSSAMAVADGMSADVQALGVRVLSADTSLSQSSSNESTSGIELTYFRTQTVTADNQKAIGRRYWGPLGDLFVVARNASFAVVQAPLGSGYTLAQYRLTGIQDLLTVPAHELLRPSGIGKDIPENTRRHLLGCDPFIAHLDRFFPDAGGDLSAAANPWASPAADNRAELLGRWTLSPGSVVSYATGDARRLFSGHATELKYNLTVTATGGGGFNAGVYGAGEEFKETTELTCGFQSSLETSSHDSRTASCVLIRNQNSADHDAIEVWYDKIFSTLMFRKPPDTIVIQGVVFTVDTSPLAWAEVEIESELGVGYARTDAVGAFDHMGVSFPATIRVGDTEIPIAERPNTPVHIKNVKPVVDFERTPVWEVALRLGIEEQQVWTLVHNRQAIFDEDDIAAALGRAPVGFRRRVAAVVFKWPRVPLERFGDLNVKDREALRKASVMTLRDLWQAAVDGSFREKLLRAGLDPHVLDSTLDALRRGRASEGARLRIVPRIRRPIMRDRPRGVLAVIWLVRRVVRLMTMRAKTQFGLGRG